MAHLLFPLKQLTSHENISFSSHQCISIALVLVATIHQAANASVSCKRSAANHLSESSSTIPNLLTSNGQLREFPYNSGEASAQSEFVHIMGRPVDQKTNTTLPMFPKGIKSYYEFSVPIVQQTSGTGDNYNSIYKI